MFRDKKMPDIIIRYTITLRTNCIKITQFLMSELSGFVICFFQNSHTKSDIPVDFHVNL